MPSLEPSSQAFFGIGMLSECHAHIFMNGVDFRQAVEQHAQRPDEDAVREHLQAYANLGIGFVREGGDRYGVSKLAKELALEYGIDYRTPLFAIHRNGCYGSIVGLGYDDLSEYSGLVARAKREGADFIKIMTTGIMDFRRFGKVTGASLDAEEVAQMVSIAHAQGLAVMSHTNGKQAVLDALAAGVDSIEHGNFIDEECLCALARSGTVYVPTACVARNCMALGHGDKGVLSKIWESSKRVIARAYELGVTCAAGSDGGAVGVPHGQGLLDEMACFEEALGSTSKARAWLEEGAENVRERFRRR